MKLIEIILLKTVPLGIGHDLYKNTIWPVIENPNRPNGTVRWWVKSATGAEVGILEHEAKEV